MNTKKSFNELMTFIRANKNKKVSTILDTLEEMTSTKALSKTFYKNDEGEVIAIHCYYFKQWMLVSEVEFGTKKHSASGYNSMCKIGMNEWSKQQREAKKASAELLSKVSSGEVSAEDIKNLQVDIEAKRTSINYDVMPQSYASLEECLKA